jgi:hypothetical protein
MTKQQQFRLVFQPEGALRGAVFEQEAAIFERTYGVARPDHVAEFAPFEDQSAFLAVLDADGAIAGFMRLIHDGPMSIKTLVEAGGPPWWIDGMRSARAVGIDPAHTWDVATLGVPRGARRNRLLITAALYHGLFHAARENDVRSLLMTVDERVRAILAAMGLITHALPGAVPGPFCGSPASTPVFGHCAQMMQVQRRDNPEAYRLIIQGHGLENVAVPPAEHFVLRRHALLPV